MRRAIGSFLPNIYKGHLSGQTEASTGENDS
jgi:hypothetical protein